VTFESGSKLRALHTLREGRRGRREVRLAVWVGCRRRYPSGVGESVKALWKSRGIGVQVFPVAEGVSRHGRKRRENACQVGGSEEGLRFARHAQAGEVHVPVRLGGDGIEPQQRVATHASDGENVAGAAGQDQPLEWIERDAADAFVCARAEVKIIHTSHAVRGVEQSVGQEARSGKLGHRTDFRDATGHNFAVGLQGDADGLARAQTDAGDGRAVGTEGGVKAPVGIGPLPRPPAWAGMRRAVGPGKRRMEGG